MFKRNIEQSKMLFITFSIQSITVSLTYNNNNMFVISKIQLRILRCWHWMCPLGPRGQKALCMILILSKYSSKFFLLNSL